MQLPDTNVRSSSYFIAETQVRCAQCGQSCRVVALSLPPNHETLVEDEWQTVGADAFIFQIAGLPHAVSRHLLECVPDFHQTRADDSSERCFANHCPQCAGIFSENELHCEAGGFMPSDAHEAQAISLTEVKQAISACAAGYALDPQFFAFMRVL